MNKRELYDELHDAAQALLVGETDFIANCANISALLFNSMPQLNWAGVYRNIDERLVLGPFQGKTACVRIAFGRGVCGTAAAQRRTLRVADVHEFQGHIACDPASASQIVVPLMKHD